MTRKHPPPTAVLADDEPALNAHLARMLARLWPELEIRAMAENGEQALAAVAAHAPDIVFLDIRMPGLSGIELAARLPARTMVVFVTAFASHALAAFEHEALDYLLKPVSEARLSETVKRSRQRLRSTEVSDLRDNLARLVDDLRSPAPACLQWLRVGKADRVELVSVDEVIYFRADLKYTAAMTARHEHLVRTPLVYLEAQLDPARFWRVHRSLIVNVAHVTAARRDLRGRYSLSLADRAEVLRVSASYAHRFKRM